MYCTIINTKNYTIHINHRNYLRLVYNWQFFSFSVSDTLPTGQLSNVPWRRSGVKYTNNEAYFDVIEEVDAIIDKSGSTVSAEIHGYVS